MLYEYEKKTCRILCANGANGTVGRGPKLPFAGVQTVAFSGATVCKGAADGRFVQTVLVVSPLAAATKNKKQKSAAISKRDRPVQDNIN